MKKVLCNEKSSNLIEPKLSCVVVLLLVEKEFIDLTTEC